MQSILHITRRARLLTLALGAIFAMGLASCGGGDDGESKDKEQSNSGSSTAGLITTDDDGDRIYLTAAGYLKFSYDSDMKLTKIGSYEVSYNPFRLTSTNTGDNEELTISDINVSKNGYITHLKSNQKEYYYGELDREINETYDFSYDSNGHLTKISASYSETGNDDGEKYKESSSATLTITWQNGLITKGAYNYSHSDGTRGTATCSFVYDDSFPNATKQYTLDFCNEFFSDFEELFMVGYMGKGPDIHPNYLTEVWKETYDGDTEEGTNESHFTYSFNSNGTVKTSRTNSYSTNSYTYTTRSGANYAPPAFVPAQQQTAEQSESRHRGFFKRHHTHGSRLTK